jgi:hypothetical protein
VLQGERIIATIEKQMSYVLESPTHYVNLGYLPGGVVALNNIANSLQTTLPVDITGNRAWETSALSGINSVNDFSSVIVLTHSAETGRTWIEQIAPHLDQTPLLMISSEQAAPVLRPYYEARPNQVQGLLVGLNGTASFETLSGLTDNARIQWNAYTIAVLAAVLTVLAGGLVAAIAAASTTNPGETR